VVWASLEWANPQKSHAILKTYQILLAYASITDLKQTFLCQSCSDFLLSHEMCQFVIILGIFFGGRYGSMAPFGSAHAQTPPTNRSIQLSHRKTTEIADTEAITWFVRVLPSMDSKTNYAKSVVVLVLLWPNHCID